MKEPTKARKPLQRRDATGHLDPKYAADLRKRSLESAPSHEDVAFFGRAKSRDSLAEALGENFVHGATAGGDLGVENLDAVPEDDGGPFVMTKGREEFARGPDASNPPEATREPFPMPGSVDVEVR